MRVSRLYTRFGKRLCDLLLGGVALVFLAPLIWGLSASIWLLSGSPVLFRQQRPGLHGKPFTLYKFRTMTDARDERGNLLPDTARAKRLNQQG